MSSNSGALFLCPNRTRCFFPPPNSGAPPDLYADRRYNELKKEIAENMEKLSPAQLVSTATSFCRLNYRHGPSWDLLCKNVEKCVFGKNPTQISLLGGKKKIMKMPPPETSSLSHSQICLVLYSLARTRVRVRERFFARMFRHMIRSPGLWNEYDLSWLLFLMRKRRFKPCDRRKPEHLLYAKVLKHVAVVFQQKMRTISPKGLIILLAEFSKLGFFPRHSVGKALVFLNKSILKRRLTNRCLAKKTTQLREERARTLGMRSVEEMLRQKRLAKRKHFLNKMAERGVILNDTRLEGGGSRAAAIESMTNANDQRPASSSSLLQSSSSLILGASDISKSPRPPPTNHEDHANDINKATGRKTRRRSALLLRDVDAPAAALLLRDAHADVPAAQRRSCSRSSGSAAPELLSHDDLSKLFQDAMSEGDHGGGARRNSFSDGEACDGPTSPVGVAPIIEPGTAPTSTRLQDNGEGENAPPKEKRTWTTVGDLDRARRKLQNEKLNDLYRPRKWLTDKSLAELARSLARLEHFSPPLLQTIAVCTIKMELKLTDYSFSMILYSFAKLRYRHLPLLKFAEQKIVKAVPEPAVLVDSNSSGRGDPLRLSNPLFANPRRRFLKDRAIVLLAYSFGKLGFRSQLSFDRLAAQFLVRLPHHSALHVSNFVLALSKVGVVPALVVRRKSSCEGGAGGGVGVPSYPREEQLAGVVDTKLFFAGIRRHLMQDDPTYGLEPHLVALLRTPTRRANNISQDAGGGSPSSQNLASLFPGSFGAPPAHEKNPLHGREGEGQERASSSPASEQSYPGAEAAVEESDPDEDHHDSPSSPEIFPAAKQRLHPISKQPMQTFNRDEPDTLLSGFTSQQLINLLDGLVVLDDASSDALGKDSKFVEKMLAQYVDSDGQKSCLKLANMKRSTQLARLLFSLTLEHPDIMRELPKSLFVLLEKYAGSVCQNRRVGGVVKYGG